MKMKKAFFLLIISIVFVALTACGMQSGSTNGGSSFSQVSNAKVNKKSQGGSENSGEAMKTIQLLKDDNVGNYLADGKGMTLYYYTKDEPGESYCKGGCLQSWPAFYGDVKNLNVPTGFDKMDFGTIKREDTGKKQITYKGYPLYYYIPDQQKGDVNGQGVGGVWYIVNSKTIFKKDSVDKKSDTKNNDGGNKGY
jgi:predicted lipoprotein with Yx(FWY)xxD motif